MADSIITIKKINQKEINNIKKDIGSAWQKNTNLELAQFDLGKKVIYHPEQITKFKHGERPFPVLVEVDLTNRCNHRCSFCFYAENIGVEADKPSLKKEILMERLTEAKKLGTKAINFTGGGEPMIHPDFIEIMKHVANSGFDVGTITNGSVITQRNVDELVDNLQWIRISVAGGDKESYKKVQGVDQFEKIVQNIKLICDCKINKQSKINIGIRTLVTPENVQSLLHFATILKNMAVDYWQLAPDQYTNDKGEFWNSDETQNVFIAIKNMFQEKYIKLLTTGYIEAQEKLDYPQTCYAHFFMIGIAAEGDVTFCKNARGENGFIIGNINKKSLSDIWNDTKTKDIESWVRPNNCGLFCKSMGINNNMEDIVHPNPSMFPNNVG